MRQRKKTATLSSSECSMVNIFDYLVYLWGKVLIDFFGVAPENAPKPRGRKS
jgi:hypothetical protein